jgi:hypothetical protein
MEVAEGCNVQRSGAFVVAPGQLRLSLLYKLATSTCKCAKLRLHFSAPSASCQSSRCSCLHNAACCCPPHPLPYCLCLNHAFWREPARILSLAAEDFPPCTPVCIALFVVTCPWMWRSRNKSIEIYFNSSRPHDASQADKHHLGWKTQRCASLNHSVASSPIVLCLEGPRPTFSAADEREKAEFEVKSRRKKLYKGSFSNDQFGRQCCKHRRMDLMCDDIDERIAAAPAALLLA